MIEINEIYNESCLITMDRMDSNAIDLVLTSPPYDDMRSYDGDWSFPYPPVAFELARILKPGGVLVWVVGDSNRQKGNESGTAFRQALHFKDVLGLNLFDTMIYLKSPNGAVGDNRGYWQTFEYMFVFAKGQPKTINLIKDRKNTRLRDEYRGISRRQKDGSWKKGKVGPMGEYGRRTNVWHYHTGRGHVAQNYIAHEHPAIFPERLAADHISSWSDPGQLVYDPFMGSGTTALMARNLGRNYIGSEISTKYCDLIKRRLAQQRMDL